MDIYTEAKVSPAGKVNKEDLKRWATNLLVFTAPMLAVFFGQLALKVDWRIAAGVALVALYQALADLFKKFTDGKK